MKRNLILINILALLVFIKICIIAKVNPAYSLVGGFMLGYILSIVIKRYDDE